VGGIGDERTCGSDAGLRDSWIFLLQRLTDDDDASFRLNSSLIRITLTNIDRIEALVRNQQPARRLNPLVGNQQPARRPTGRLIPRTITIHHRFYARQRRYSAYMLWQFRLSVRLSVTRVD